MFGILTILIIILTIIIATQRPAKNVEKTHHALSKPSPTHSPSPTPTIILSPSPKPNNTYEATQPTVIPPTATLTPKPNQPSQAISDFQYPSSNVVSINGNTEIFESSDDPKKITDWYKDKIKNMGMVATSFVQTNTNDNILNKLVGANGEREVRVEITKKNYQPAVRISVTL